MDIQCSYAVPCLSQLRDMTGDHRRDATKRSECSTKDHIELTNRPKAQNDRRQVAILSCAGKLNTEHSPVGVFKQLG